MGQHGPPLHPRAGHDERGIVDRHGQPAQVFFPPDRGAQVSLRLVQQDVVGLGRKLSHLLEHAGAVAGDDRRIVREG